MDPATNVESSLYMAIFTAAEGYSAASSTAATSARPSPPTARSTATNPPNSNSTSIAHPGFGPAAKIGLALGVPLGACGLAALALLLYRHGKHKERSRKTQMGNLAPPGDLASAAERKKLTEVGAPEQTFGRSPPVYSMEMQG